MELLRFLWLGYTVVFLLSVAFCYVLRAIARITLDAKRDLALSSETRSISFSELRNLGELTAIELACTLMLTLLTFGYLVGIGDNMHDSLKEVVSVCLPERFFGAILLCSIPFHLAIAGSCSAHVTSLLRAVLKPR